MRLDLPDGQWADLRERLDYGPARLVRRAFLAASEDRQAGADVDMELVKAYVTVWSVKDAAGELVSIEEPWKANDEAIQLIALRAAKVWNGKASPKDSSETSPSSLRALG